MHGWVLLALARAALVQVEEGRASAALAPAVAPAARGLGVRPAVRADLRRVVAVEQWADAGTEAELARVPGSSAALAALLRKLQDDHRTWEAAFDWLDADNSGELDQDEIEAAMMPFISDDGVGLDLVEGYAKAIILAMDTDGNGTVDRGEFVAWLSANHANVGAEAAGIVECMSDDECLAEAMDMMEPWTDAGTDVELARVPGSSAALTALLSKLQDNHRTWEAAFDALDADDSGELDQGEIAQALLPFIPEDGAADLAEGYAKAIIFAMDTDRNGTVDSGEFQAWLEANQASVGAEAAGVVECMSDDECLAEAIVTNAFTSWSANGAAFQDAGPKADPEAAGGAEEKPEKRVRTPGPRTAGAPPPADLSDEAMLSIVLQEMSDADVNELAWKYLGYRYDIGRGRWDASEVFPKWAAKYPTPPDLIGVTRTYSREVDEPVLRAVQALQRSVPTEHKDNLRAYLAPLGWTGYKMQAPAHAKATTGLTPNMTRRAQVAQWLYYYREALHGVPVAELRKRRDARAAAEAAAEAAGEAPRPTGTTKQGVL